MRIVRIDQSNKEDFAHLDTFEKMVLLQMPGVFAYGLIEDMNPERETHVGLMVGDIGSEVLNIVWIAVMEDHQKQGYGELLLRYAFDTARSLYIDNIALKISGEYEFEIAALKYSDDFKSRMFVNERKDAGEWWGEIHDLLQQPLFSGANRNLPKPIALSKLSDHRQRDLFGKLADREDCMEIYHIGSRIDRIDPNISFIFFYEDEPCGAILGDTSEGVLVPVFFYAESRQEAASLILCFFAAAIKKYGRNYLTYIPGRSKDMQMVIYDIIPKQLQAGKVYVAKSSDYDQLYY